MNVLKILFVFASPFLVIFFILAAGFSGFNGGGDVMQQRIFYLALAFLTGAAALWLVIKSLFKTSGAKKFILLGFLGCSLLPIVYYIVNKILQFYSQ
jgi:hypothetical protein